MEIKRVNDVKKYIKGKYVKLSDKKFDVVKIGMRIYVYAVDRESNLQRAIIFRGNLPAINEVPVLMRAFEKGVNDAMRKWGYE